MSRLTIDVSAKQHQTLKARAALEGKTIRQYALERLFPDDTEAAVQELKAMLQARLAAAEKGEVTQRTSAEIAEQAIHELDAS